MLSQRIKKSETEKKSEDPGQKNCSNCCKQKLICQTINVTVPKCNAKKRIEKYIVVSIITGALETALKIFTTK